MRDLPWPNRKYSSPDALCVVVRPRTVMCGAPAHHLLGERPVLLCSEYNGGIVNTRVHDLMTRSVVTTERNSSIEQVRRLLEEHAVGAIPIVDQVGRPVGIVSSTDLLRDLDPGSPVEMVMTEEVHTVPQYDDVSVAARVMRNHRIHRVVVTHEKASCGCPQLVRPSQAVSWPRTRPPSRGARAPNGSRLPWCPPRSRYRGKTRRRL